MPTLQRDRSGLFPVAAAVGGDRHGKLILCACGLWKVVKIIRRDYSTSVAAAVISFNSVHYLVLGKSMELVGSCEHLWRF